MLRNIRRIAVAATLIAASFGTLAVTATPAHAQRTHQEQSDFYGGLSGAQHSLETTVSGINKTMESMKATLKLIEKLEEDVADGKASADDKAYLKRLKKSAGADADFIEKQTKRAREALEFIEREIHRIALQGINGRGASDGPVTHRNDSAPRSDRDDRYIHQDGGLDPRTLPVPEYTRRRIEQPASGPNDGLAGPLPKIRGRYDVIEKKRHRDSRPEDGLAGPPPAIKGRYESIDKLNGKRPDGYKPIGPTTPLGGQGYKPVGPITPLGGTQGQTIKTTVGAPVIRTGR